MANNNITIGLAKKRITCCYQCEDREVGCHGTCEQYKKEKAEYNEDTERMVAESQKYNMQNKLEADRAFSKRKCFKNTYRRRRRR